MLYIPPHFRETDTAQLHAQIRRIGFASLTTVGPDGPLISHLPLVLDTTVGPLGQLRGHVSRANPQWRDSDLSRPALAVFMGPDTYVSPSWYPSKQEHGKVVPTWNYAIVQVRGTARVIDDAAWLRGQVDRLTGEHEGRRPAPWGVDDAPEAFVASQIKGIIGLEIDITEIEGKWKTSQNRPAADVTRVAQALADPAEPAAPPAPP